MAINATHKGEKITLHNADDKKSISAKVNGIFVGTWDNAHKALQGAREFVDECFKDEHANGAKEAAKEPKTAVKTAEHA